MTFGNALELMLRKSGYALVSEFVTVDRRLAVRLRELRTSTVVAMYHSDAIELARGGATVAAIVHRNRSVFPAVAVAREPRVNPAPLNVSTGVPRVAPVSPDTLAINDRAAG